MPTKKQRRRQAKAKRHEYEYVLVDEQGQETPVDPAELRAAKEKPAAGKGKGKAPARTRSGRPLREPRKPSWRRALRMGLLFVVAVVLFTSFVGGKNKPSLVGSLVLGLGYALVGVPMFYWMDRWAYSRWERASGRAPEPRKR